MLMRFVLRSAYGAVLLDGILPWEQLEQRHTEGTVLTLQWEERGSSCSPGELPPSWPLGSTPGEAICLVST